MTWNRAVSRGVARWRVTHPDQAVRARPPRAGQGHSEPPAVAYGGYAAAFVRPERLHQGVSQRGGDVARPAPAGSVPRSGVREEFGLPAGLVDDVVVEGAEQDEVGRVSLVCPPCPPSDLQPSTPASPATRKALASASSASSRIAASSPRAWDGRWPRSTSTMTSRPTPARPGPPTHAWCPTSRTAPGMPSSPTTSTA